MRPSNSAEALLGAGRERLEQRARLAAANEADIQERLCELAERESALEAREARTSLDLELRLDQIEQQECELRTLAERLDARERDLRAYVADIQRALSRGSAPAGSKPARA